VNFDRPDRLVFDLVAWADIIAAAVEARARVKANGL
jgi:hypothetical protein